MRKINIILMAILSISVGIYFYTNKNSNSSLHLHRTVENNEYRKWMDFYPENEPFSASFPNKPITSSRDLTIPGSDKSLSYKEFIYEMDNDILFSVSYTTLPKEWLKYGSNLVLGGALKIIMKELGKVELVGKDSTIFKSFPALDYEHYTLVQENQKETAGTLVLVKDILYKIEMTYPLNLRTQFQDDLANFIANFTPKNIEQNVISQRDISKFDNTTLFSYANNEKSPPEATFGES